MSTVITGASGNLGRRVVELLLDEHGVAPSELILVTRTPDRLSDFAERGAQVRAGDFDRPDELPAAFAGAELMLLISAEQIGERVRQHTNAVNAAKDAGIAHVVYTSYVNTDVEDNPSAIAPEHLATEKAIRAAGLTFTFLRNSIYAEMQIPDATAALATGKLVTNAGDGRAAYVSREDCAAVAAAVLANATGHENAVYDVTGPELIDAQTLAALYADVGGKPVEPVLVDDAAFVQGLVEHAGMPEPVAEAYATFGAAIRAGLLEVQTDVVERLTGRTPRTQRDVLEQHAAALRA
jgi:NAD(P)H dehydrogenase (quinone)